MFYLDYIIYIILIILTWILIYKIINMKETTKKKITREMVMKDTVMKDTVMKDTVMKDTVMKDTVMKEGFAHRGNAIVVKNPTTNQLGLKDLNGKSGGFDVFSIAQALYGFVSIFADVFVKYPTKYVRQLGTLAQGPLESLANNFNDILDKVKIQARGIIDKIKPYTNKSMPFSIFDFSKMITKLIDKIFSSLGQVLKPRDPN